jgi:osmotically-inducible protein OsmY
MKKNNPVIMIIAGVVVLGAIGALLANQVTGRIESTAKKSYVFMTYLNNDNIKVEANNDSVVTLTGTVSQWSHRSLAEETVAGLPGVKQVNNNLEISGELPVENSDAWTTMKIKSMLMFHWNVSYLTTDVAVKGGVATLSGKASSEAQKELTTEYVKDVDGITSVINNMAVEKTGKTAIEKVSDRIDDASITAQVKLALLFHKSTSAIRTTVETKNGKVTVSGIAKNAAEKDLVGKLVLNINGVKGLKNNMTI